MGESWINFRDSLSWNFQPESFDYVRNYANVFNWNQNDVFSFTHDWKDDLWDSI